MRKRHLILSAVLPLAAAACSHNTMEDRGWPVPAQLSDRQAAVLASNYLDGKVVGSPRTLVSEEKQHEGWWLRYNGPFSSASKPPQGSYLVDVNNDGTVREVH